MNCLIRKSGLCLPLAGLQPFWNMLIHLTLEGLAASCSAFCPSSRQIRRRDTRLLALRYGCYLGQKPFIDLSIDM